MSLQHPPKVAIIPLQHQHPSSVCRERPSEREAIWNRIFESTSGRSTCASTPTPLPSRGNFTQNDTTTSTQTTGAPSVPLIYISHNERDLEGNDVVKSPEVPSRGTPKLGELLQQQASDLRAEVVWLAQGLKHTMSKDNR